MDRFSSVAKVLLSWAGGGVVGTIATYVILGTVPASDLRTVVLALLWPLVIVCATVLGWRWLGRPHENAARSALTEVIVAGRKLRERLVEADDGTPDDQAAWKIRVGDWYEEAVAVVGRVAHDRQSAFVADPLYADHAHKGLPEWKQGLLLDLDVRIDQLVVMRGSL